MRKSFLKVSELQLNYPNVAAKICLGCIVNCYVYSLCTEILKIKLLISEGNWDLLLHYYSGN